MLENKLRKAIDNYRKNKRLNLILSEYSKSSKKAIFLLQTPIHTNIGDQAIAQAEVNFIRKNASSMSFYEIDQSLLDLFCQKATKLINKDDIIMLHGGGNMGDQYLHEEEHRRKVVQCFPNNKIIIFPQTFYFTDSKFGQDNLQITSSVFSKHQNLVVIAREKVSFELMKKAFPNNKIILTPDIVLSMNVVEPILEREGVLLVLRNDVEKLLSEEISSTIFTLSNKLRSKVTVSDMYHNKNVYSESSRKNVLEDKFNQFKTAEIVVTDRLHGMIFAAITQTPCIAFTNYNQKVSGTYKWIENLDYIRFVDLNADIEVEMNNLLSVKSSSRLVSLELDNLFTIIVDELNN